MDGQLNYRLLLVLLITLILIAISHAGFQGLPMPP